MNCPTQWWHERGGCAVCGCQLQSWVASNHSTWGHALCSQRWGKMGQDDCQWRADNSILGILQGEVPEAGQLCEGMWLLSSKAFYCHWHLYLITISCPLTWARCSTTDNSLQPSWQDMGAANDTCSRPQTVLHPWWSKNDSCSPHQTMHHPWTRCISWKNLLFLTPS